MNRRKTKQRGEEVRTEPRWPAALAVVLAIGLYQTLPARFTFGPGWLLPVVEACLLLPLLATSPRRTNEEAKWKRVFAILLIALINLANVISLIALVHALLAGRQEVGKNLLFDATQFGSPTFSSLDSGMGVGSWWSRRTLRSPPPRTGFSISQMANPGAATADWHPSFVDYLYVSFTNATAFSPTDTMPLTEWAKVLDDDPVACVAHHRRPGRGASGQYPRRVARGVPFLAVSSGSVSTKRGREV